MPSILKICKSEYPNVIIPNYSSVSNLGLGKKTRIRRTEPNPVQKSSIEPEPKLINRTGSKFWYLKNQNRTRSEPKYFGYLDVSQIDL